MASSTPEPSLGDNRLLDGKRILVTGAAQGMGRAIAVRAAQQGAESVAIVDLDPIGEEIRITLLHEVGHFLGLDEDRLRELGLD